MLHYSFIFAIPLLSGALPSASQETFSGTKASGGCGVTSDTALPESAVSGEATFYDEWDSAAVSCNPDKCPKDGWCAAIPAKYMANKSGGTNGQVTKESCGKCIKVVHNSKAVVLRVMDTCPGCGETNVDLSVPAFEELTGGKGQGRVAIKWAFVNCNGESSDSKDSIKRDVEDQAERPTKSTLNNATESATAEDTNAVTLDLNNNANKTDNESKEEHKKEEMSVSVSEQKKESEVEPSTASESVAAAITTTDATTAAATTSGQVEEVERSSGNAPKNDENVAVKADKKIDNKKAKTPKSAATAKDQKSPKHKHKQQNKKLKKKQKKQKKQKTEKQANNTGGSKHSKRKERQKRKQERRKQRNNQKKRVNKQKIVKKEERIEESQ